MTDIEGTIKLKCFKCGTILDKSEVKMDSYAGLYHEDCRRDIEEATCKTAEYLGCTPYQLEKAINHFKKIEEAEANEPKKKLNEIIRDLRFFSSKLRGGYHLFPLLDKLEKFRDEEL